MLDTYSLKPLYSIVHKGQNQVTLHAWEFRTQAPGRSIGLLQRRQPLVPQQSTTLHNFVGPVRLVLRHAKPISGSAIHERIIRASKAEFCDA